MVLISHKTIGTPKHIIITQGTMCTVSYLFRYNSYSYPYCGEDLFQNYTKVTHTDAERHHKKFILGSTLNNSQPPHSLMGFVQYQYDLPLQHFDKYTQRGSILPIFTINTLFITYLFVHTLPIITSVWPLMYFVTDSITISAPRSRGRWR